MPSSGRHKILSLEQPGRSVNDKGDYQYGRCQSPGFLWTKSRVTSASRRTPATAGSVTANPSSKTVRHGPPMQMGSPPSRTRGPAHSRHRHNSLRQMRIGRDLGGPAHRRRRQPLGPREFVFSRHGSPFHPLYEPLSTFGADPTGERGLQELAIDCFRPDSSSSERDQRLASHVVVGRSPFQIRRAVAPRSFRGRMQMARFRRHRSEPPYSEALTSCLLQSILQSYAAHRHSPAP
jgi:hypothetical protein